MHLFQAIAMCLATFATLPLFGMALTISDARKKAELDTRYNTLNSGTVKIYDGTRPAGPDTAITTQNLLATLTMGATAFAAATGTGTVTKTANAITGANAVATGTATWFRAFNGATAIADGSAGTSATDMILNSASIASGAAVSATSWVITAGG